MDKIRIEGLEVSCHIGVREQERRRRQRIVLDITCHCSVAGAAAADDLERTVDYSALAERIVRTARNSRFLLIETLAERTAGLCLEDTRVSRAVVRVTKPGAIRGASGASVEVTRDRRGTVDGSGKS